MNPASTDHPSRRVTRLAPSPTGALHLGNARTFLITWAIARRRCWRVLLRLDDLAGPRVKRGASEQALDDLAWLGLDWDGAPIAQSTRLGIYVAAMRDLARRGLVFPCSMTRREIETALEAPHEPPTVADAAAVRRETRFPPDLRPPLQPRDFEDAARRTGWRFATPSGMVRFEDAVAGPVELDPAATIGDFIVWTKDGEPAYQLATVIDDHDLGVTDVIRGDDLLDSAGRQRLLGRALGLTPEPRQWHLPLVVGPDGRRLAKRHGDTRLAHYRDLGVPAGRLVALLARWSGVPDAGDAMSAQTFAERFDPATMPRERVVFTAEDDAWLHAGS